jgi:hypothetical protein
MVGTGRWLLVKLGGAGEAAHRNASAQRNILPFSKFGFAKQGAAEAR